MNSLYFNMTSGVSGDMLNSALINILTEQEFKEYRDRIDKLENMLNISIETGHRLVSSINVSFFKVNKNSHHSKILHGDKDSHIHRNLKDIKKILERLNLSDNEKELALLIFSRLAKAESKVHACSIDEIHFHEVGALDSIGDILSFVILHSILNISQIFFNEFILGHGFVKCAHGELPVPVPAVTELLKGYRVYQSNIETELTTPTGAAILTTIGIQNSNFIGTYNRRGFGSGSKILDIPNILTVFMGHDTDFMKCIKKNYYNSERLFLLETNIDDMDPRDYAIVMDKLFDAGALDVWIENIIMKKGRPAEKISILTGLEKREKLIDIIFRETTSLGIRVIELTRYYLIRKNYTINTEDGKVSYKKAIINEKIQKIILEHSDLLKLSKKLDLPLHSIRSMLIKQIYKK